MFKEKFAKNLRESRKLTQEQLAELVGVDFRYISLLENAKSFPSCDLIEKLVKALNINYSELFAFDEDLSREEIENRLGELIKFISDKNLKILYNIAKEI